MTISEHKAHIVAQLNAHMRETLLENLAVAKARIDELEKEIAEKAKPADAAPA